MQPSHLLKKIILLIVEPTFHGCISLEPHCMMALMLQDCSLGLGVLVSLAMSLRWNFMLLTHSYYGCYPRDSLPYKLLTTTSQIP
jgi:hypothetical protein